MQTLRSLTVGYIVCKVVHFYDILWLHIYFKQMFITTGMCLKSLANTITKNYFKLLYDSNIIYIQIYTLFL